MPDNPSSFSRTFAANAARSHMQAHNRMAKHGHQAINRQLEQMRGLSREAARPTHQEDPGDSLPQPRRRGWVGVILLVVAALAVGAWLIRAPSNPVRDTIVGVHATVRSGTEWNVRRGPSTSYPSIGIVQSGQDVTVACAQGSWIKITSPMTGFVSKKGLILRATPEAC
jgi:uncharacterized protein YgiM (DUF1202 family)